MKRVLLVYLLSTIVFFSFAQQIDIQRITYNEENSALPTSVCYNWNQLNNGGFFVSGNAGIFLFDGVNFKHFKTNGRGLAISSSIEDNTGRLWCNSFHGDVHYMEQDSLVRHSISDSIRGLTFFHLVNNRLFLYTETELYEVNTKTLEIKLLKKFNLIRTLFSLEKHPYLLNSKSNGKTEIINLTTMRSTYADKFPFVENSSCRLIEGRKTPYLFFERERKFMRADDFINGKAHKVHTLYHDGKINYITLVDEQIAVCGMDGINMYSLSGRWLNKMLSETQVTHFGKDQEGNYVATSVTQGLILIPDMNVSRSDYSDYLNHEEIIQSVFDDEQYLYLGTNAGKILRHNLKNQKIEVLELGLRSEVLSMQLSKDGTKLFVYCDDLYLLDAIKFKVNDKLTMSSVKEMALWGDDLILGTRKGIELFVNDGFKELAEVGWVISMLPLEERNELLIASKNGLFLFDMELNSTLPLDLVETDNNGTFSSLTQVEKEIFFIYNHQIVYRCSEDFKNVEPIYKHVDKGINRLIYQNDRLLLFSEGEILQLTPDGILTQAITELQGLNENHIIDGFSFLERSYYVHKKSVSAFKGSPRPSRIRPEISFCLNQKSTFHKQDNIYTSNYDGNELVFHFDIRRALHTPGQIDIFYCFDLKEQNWKKFENPYSEIRLERLPIGSGFVYFKASNPDGVTSEVIPISYYVKPPFYLSIWFIALVLLLLISIVTFIVKWRVRLIRKKNLERLEKEQLESRLLHAELTAIRSQMNPHFIFNVLTAIQAKVIQQKIDEAYTNIGDFAILIRNVLEKSGKEYISLEEEVALMKNYVELENSRLKQPISFEVRVDNPEYFEGVFIPTLITQPLIENAIKHAFTPPVRNPKITLEAQSSSNGFSLKINDNGAGFDKESSFNDHQPFALSTLRKRIQVLSITAPYKIELSIRTGGEGTQVEFIFNYKQT